MWLWPQGLWGTIITIGTSIVEVVSGTHYAVSIVEYIANTIRFEPKAQDARMTAHKLRWLDDRERPVVANQSAPTA